MQHIETIELTSSQSSITFSSIPQDFTDLVVFILSRSTGTSSRGFIYPNGDTASQTNVVLSGNGDSPFSSTNLAYRTTPSNATANTFANASLYLSNYTASQNKSFSSDSATENNGTTAFQSLVATLWSSTSAITSLEFEVSDGNIDTGSTFSLYGITAGGDGTVTTS